MADHALFVGWGEVVPGREQRATRVFGETMAYFGRLQQEGAVAGVEPFFLEPHGGDLGGFFLVRGRPTTDRRIGSRSGSGRRQPPLRLSQKRPSLV